MSIPNIIKKFQTIKKLWCAQEFGIEIRSRDIIRRRKNQELFSLHAIFLLDLIYCSYQLSSNYLKQYGSYGLQNILASVDIHVST